MLKNCGKIKSIVAKLNQYAQEFAAKLDQYAQEF